MSGKELGMVRKFLESKREQELRSDIERPMTCPAMRGCTTRVPCTVALHRRGPNVLVFDKP
jgi:hypothetical protein